VLDNSIKDYILNKNEDTGYYEFHDFDPDDFIFNKDILSNSKGVTKLKHSDFIDNTRGDIGKQIANQVYIKFNLDGIVDWIQYTQDITNLEKVNYWSEELNNYDVSKYLK
jgi:hypothetical protein